MKKITLLGAASVDGIMRYPSEGSIGVEPAEAERLIKLGLAQMDDLNALPLDDVRAVAAEEGVPVGPAVKKSETVDAIRDHRTNKI